MTPELSRRSLLKVGGGAVLGLGLGAGRLPAWARAPARAAQGLGPGALPFPNLPEGTDDDAADRAHRRADDGEPLLRQHLRDAAEQAPTRRGVDGLPVDARPPDAGQPRPKGATCSKLASTPCQDGGLPARAGTRATSRTPTGATTASCGPAARSRWATGTRHDCPSTTRWPRTSRSATATSARCLAQTYPNRRFLFTGTAGGTIATDAATFSIPAAERHDLRSLRPLRDRLEGLLRRPPEPTHRPGHRRHRRPAGEVRDHDRLPLRCEGGEAAVVLASSSPHFSYESEEDPQDIQVGERFVAAHHQRGDDVAQLGPHGAAHHLRRARRLLRPRPAARRRPARRHPADARAQRPPRRLRPLRLPRAADRVSPWARRDYVSHVVHDHTSSSSFIERSGTSAR